MPCVTASSTDSTDSAAPAAGRRVPARTGAWRLGRALAALAMLLPLILATAGAARAAEHIVLASYQEREGLLSLTPTCLLQDRQSTVWICTENGLFRFDGFRVRAEPLPAAIGTSLWGGRMDPSGRLWLTTERGVFVRQPSVPAPDRRDLLEPAQWVTVARPDGSPLDVFHAQQFDVDGNGEMVAYDRDHRYWTATVDVHATGTVAARLLPVPAHARPRGTPFVDSSPLRLVGGRLWFGCGAGLCSWDRQQLEVSRWAAPQGLPEDTWATLYVGRDGSLWARGRNRLARLAPQAQRFEVIAAPPPNRAWEASSPMVEDAQGRLLVSTEHGFARWEGQTWREWTREEGLPDAAVRVLLSDASGSLWVGASGQGVHRWIGYGQVEHWTRESGLPSGVVFRILEDGSRRLWAFTRRGVAWFDPARRRFVPVGETLSGPSALDGAAVDAAGNLWWLNNGRLMTIKAGTTAPREVLRDETLLILMGGHGGSLYLASGDRVERLTPGAAGRGPSRTLVADGVPDGQPPIEVFNDGTADWFVDTGWHLHRAEGGRWLPMLDDRGGRVQGSSPVIAEGRLWVIDREGIAMYALAGDRAHLLRRLPRASFGGADLMWLERGPGDGLWLGTDRGVFRLDGEGGWQGLLDRTTGLVWNDTNSDSFLIDSAGDAWVGTSAGLTRVLPGGRLTPSPAKLRADLLEFGPLRFDAPPRDPVPWQARQLRVTLGTPAFTIARALRIEYRLSSEAAWRGSEGAVIDIGMLDAGSHVLEVRAAPRVPLEPPGEVLRLPFVIAPPWWNSAGAKLAALAALAALYWTQTVWTQRRARRRRRELERAIALRTEELEASQAALHRLSAHNAMALEEERKRVSRELHDELGQQLAALRLEISVLRSRAAKASPPGTAQLDLLHERVDGLIATMRSVVSQLRPPALDGGLSAALRWLGSEFSRDTGVPCAMWIPPEANHLSAEVGTLMFRIVQESLNNVRRHAGASHVDLRLNGYEGAWTLTVRDDGRGFDPGVRSAGHGLLGMQERARLMGGTLHIVSAPGQGTAIELRVVPGAPLAPP
ncbi:histidine kinase [Roseateles sp.]|uniref:sensor histidine kinase n=1 Tax=Roseateles sp. TaxID=1971397 RepID=UPI0031E1B77A